MGTFTWHMGHVCVFHSHCSMHWNTFEKRLFPNVFNRWTIWKWQHININILKKQTNNGNNISCLGPFCMHSAFLCLSVIWMFVFSRIFVNSDFPCWPAANTCMTGAAVTWPELWGHGRYMDRTECIVEELSRSCKKRYILILTADFSKVKSKHCLLR